MATPQIRGNIIDTDQVLVEEKGAARILKLNRPKQLNALSAEMILKMLKLYTAYEEDSKVKLIIMKGQGRAFCAGGDVAAVAHHINEGNKSYGADFFWNEFILNYIIATYRKPQVSILNGIVMGGGAGVSIHGKFRVATEKTLFAMPETALGLFPDIGSSYFLSRTPGYFGEYVGLTGARLDGPEILACGLATHFVHSTKLDSLEDSLVRFDTSDSFKVCEIIDKFSQSMPLKDGSAFNRLDIIDKCFSKETVEEIIYALEHEVKYYSDRWIIDAIDSLKKASPISLKITLRNIREGRSRQVGQCLIQDYRLCLHVLSKELSNDFFEGCRALLVDKDKNPKWEPSRLELVDDKTINAYFSEVEEDLKLPERKYSRVASVSKL